MITLAETLGIALPARTETKPRDCGLTMVMDQGWPTDFTAGMLDQFGQYLDIAKLWDPMLLSPAAEVERKLRAYRDADVLVQPGGLFLEMAERKGTEREALRRLADFGFNAVELSSTTATRGGDMGAELELIAAAKEFGFRVVGEVGRKFVDGDETRLTSNALDIEVTVREFKSLLEAGAWKVYWEGHLLREVMGDDPETIHERAATGTSQVLDVVRQVGGDNIIFEASGLRPRANRQWLQFWLVRMFGPDVNIGNARIDELANLEAIRRGNHPIFGFGNAGNYPWLRAGNDGTTRWWRG
ncbi:MAG: phosphosulfolactate synthase [Candidatus Limnocylindrales bacterium]